MPDFYPKEIHHAKVVSSTPHSQHYFAIMLRRT
jgi:hypothetical protein